MTGLSVADRFFLRRLCVAAGLLALSGGALAQAAPAAPADHPALPAACRVPGFRGAASPQGADAQMHIVNTGQPCAIPNYGFPAEQRNPAYAGVITKLPVAGKVEFVPPRAIYTPAAGFAGEDQFEYEASAEGLSRPLRVRVRVFVSGAPAASPGPAQSATGDAAAPKITMIYMGGNDCPPCVAWRREELPKLEAAPAFRAIEFIYVQKMIQSAVPPLFFLPEAARPYKPLLDQSGGGMSGSPQVAVLVNGEIHDYYYGRRSAEEVLAMIDAINRRTPYPFDRCLRRTDRMSCAEVIRKP